MGHISTQGRYLRQVNHWLFHKATLALSWGHRLVRDSIGVGTSRTSTHFLSLCKTLSLSHRMGDRLEGGEYLSRQLPAVVQTVIFC